MYWRARTISALISASGALCVFGLVGCGSDDVADEAKDWYGPWYYPPSEVSANESSPEVPVVGRSERSLREAVAERPSDVIDLTGIARDRDGQVPVLDIESQSDPLLLDDGSQGVDRDMTIKVQRGETVSLYSRWSGVDESELRANNDMKRKNLRIGQPFTLRLRPKQFRAFEKARTDHFLNLEKAYFARNTVLRLDRYTVEKGDHIWRISKRFDGVPVWVLEKFNTNRDLSKLKVGDELLVPIIQEIAAEGSSAPEELFADEAKKKVSAPSPQKAKAETAGDTIRVTVARNETLGHYARWGKIKVKDIVAANPGMNPDVIRLGQKVRLPIPDSRLTGFFKTRRRFNGTPPPADLPGLRAPRQKAAKKAPEPQKKKVPTRVVDARKKAAAPAPVKAAARKAGKPTVAKASVKVAARPEPVTEALVDPGSPAARVEARAAAPVDVAAPAAEKAALVAEKVAAAKAPSEVEDRWVRHEVRSGETAWTIAVQRYKITLRQLRTANPGRNLDRLLVGDVLTIPVSASTPGGDAGRRTP